MLSNGNFPYYCSIDQGMDVLTEAEVKKSQMKFHLHLMANPTYGS